MPAYRKILIPYDGSEPGRRAAEKGLELAADQKAEVVGIKVISFIGELITPSDTLWATIEVDLHRKARAILDELEAMARARGVEIRTEVLEGDASDETVAYADRMDADLIVMGIGGRGGMGRYMGKNVLRILREAPCPVMVVR